MGLFTWTQDSELPRGNHCPKARVTSRSHDNLLSRGKLIVIWSLRIYLNSFSFCTNCHREWILNMFTYFWCFLEIFVRQLILNINNEHAQDYSCPRATFAFCSHGEKLPRQGGLPGVVQRVIRLSKLPRGNEKLVWTVTVVRPCTAAKLTPGSVSCPGAISCPGIMWTGPMMVRTFRDVSKFASVNPATKPCLEIPFNYLTHIKFWRKRRSCFPFGYSMFNFM